MKKHIIYDSNWAIEESDGDDFYDFHFDDEVGNLNQEVENGIICIAELHLWNGVKSGYKILERDNLNEILYTGCGDYKKVLLENHDVVMYDTHHDGTNRYIFREIKNNDKIHNLTDKIYNNNNFTQKDVTRYTKSLSERVKKIYGW